MYVMFSFLCMESYSNEKLGQIIKHKPKCFRNARCKYAYGACANFIKKINMAEKSAKTIGVGPKPVPMKFFAVLEVEKTAPSCIPRYSLYIF